MTSSPNQNAALARYAGPQDIASFRTIFDLNDLGVLAEPHRLAFGAHMRSCAPSPLFRAESLPSLVVSEHTGRIVVPGPEYLAVPGYELGSFGLLQQQGRVFVNARVMPAGQFRPETMPPHWVRGLFAPDADLIESDAPVGIVLNPHLVWGHFLLEMLGRMHLLAELRTLGRPIRVAMPLDAPQWVQDFFALYFTADEMLPYHSARQRVRAPSFVLPSMMMMHYYLHPLFNTVVRTLLDRVASPVSPRRLYLSRRRHGAGWHGLTNEAEVEAVVTDLGFIVVHPQEMSLPAQLALFAEAECIVAQYSSAAHNSLFAPFGTPVFCLGWMNRCQSGIAVLRGQPVAYMALDDGNVIYPPADRPPGKYLFHIDCRTLARELPAFLEFSARMIERQHETNAVA